MVTILPPPASKLSILYDEPWWGAWLHDQIATLSVVPIIDALNATSPVLLIKGGN